MGVNASDSENRLGPAFPQLRNVLKWRLGRRETGGSGKAAARLASLCHYQDHVFTPTLRLSLPSHGLASSHQSHGVPPQHGHGGVLDVFVAFRNRWD